MFERIEASDRFVPVVVIVIQGIRRTASSDGGETEEGGERIGREKDEESDGRNPRARKSTVRQN